MVLYHWRKRHCGLDNTKGGNALTCLCIGAFHGVMDENAGPPYRIGKQCSTQLHPPPHVCIWLRHSLHNFFCQVGTSMLVTFCSRLEYMVHGHIECGCCRWVIKYTLRTILQNYQYRFVLFWISVRVWHWVYCLVEGVYRYSDSWVFLRIYLLL